MVGEGWCYVLGWARCNGHGGMAAGAPRAVQSHDHGRPHLRQQRGAEVGPELAPAAQAVVGPDAAGGKVGGWGRKEEEAAGDDNRDAAVERAAMREVRI